jgi:hypothetical protein
MSALEACQPTQPVIWAGQRGRGRLNTEARLAERKFPPNNNDRVAAALASRGYAGRGGTLLPLRSAAVLGQARDAMAEAFLALLFRNRGRRPRPGAVLP